MSNPLSTDPVLGEPFPLEETSAEEVLAALPPYTAVVHDPPWSSLAGRVPAPRRTVRAWNMDLKHLDSLAAAADDSEVVVGIGGGTALDTAKFIAWRCQRTLVQIPTITSVDAGFTDAVGVRDQGRVRYVGTVRPQRVIADLELIGKAPQRLNRAGIGDVLSCHTGMADWAAASGAGLGVPWDGRLADLGRRLLADLDAMSDEIRDCTPRGLRFLLQAYREIGAACSAAGHSRFEEGSEHFFAYAYEHRTGSHLVHGELVSMAVLAMASIQGNSGDWARDLVTRCQVHAHPDDLGISAEQFHSTIRSLPDYIDAEGLDPTGLNLQHPTPEQIAEAWNLVRSLPRHREDR